MTITAASEADLEYINKASDKILEHHRIIDDFYQPVGNQSIQASQKEKISFVAKHESQLVGFISGCIITAPDRSISYALIQAVWVEEPERGKEIAQELVKCFEKNIESKGVSRIELSVDIRNKQGRELWDGAGYQTYQERKFKSLT